jgi:hypothetical protein
MPSVQSLSGSVCVYVCVCVLPLACVSEPGQWMRGCVRVLGAAVSFLQWSCAVPRGSVRFPIDTYGPVQF